MFEHLEWIHTVLKPSRDKHILGFRIEGLGLMVQRLELERGREFRVERER